LVELGFESGRLADLVQSLAKSDAMIMDLKTDRPFSRFSVPERSAEVTFVVTSLRRKNGILKRLAADGFVVRELGN
jgi:hypothetical protein